MTAENFIEKIVAKRLVLHMLKEGYSISVNDGETTTLRRARNADKIEAAMFTTDEDMLYFHRADVQGVYPATGRKADAAGWALLIYGNHGCDVISDYASQLEADLRPVFAFADEIEKGNIPAGVKVTLKDSDAVATQ